MPSPIMLTGTIRMSEQAGPITPVNGQRVYGDGAKIINDTELPAILVEGQVVAQTNITSNLPYGSWALQSPFHVNVADTSGFAAGDRVALNGDSNREYNVVAEIGSGTLGLADRPVYPHGVGDIVQKLAAMEDVEINGDLHITGESTGSAIQVANARNINIDALRSDLMTSGDFVKVIASEDVSVARCRMTGGTHGVSIDNQSRNCVVSGNRLYRVRNGVLIEGRQNRILGNEMLNCGAFTGDGDGITVAGRLARDNVISDNIIEAGHCYGIWVNGGGLAPGGPSGVNINNNRISSGITAGIYLYSGEGFSVVGNEITSNSSGIVTQNVSRVVVSHNKVCRNRGAGIFIYDGSIGIIIDNNNIWANRMESTSVYYDDIAIAFASKVRVSRNTLGRTPYIGNGVIDYAASDNLIV